ncbi:hypothetical protein [Brevibacillus parabrevis]|nr:hypothetical protein [Brevibacillus parabrevis]MDR5001118.1 hypothetical protein [Brevibacillus parabrevis]
MGNIGIALGGRKAFSAPIWSILLIIGFAALGIRQAIKRTKN